VDRPVLGLYLRRGEQLPPMSAQHLVDFYYAIGSRYSYLASTQIPQLERETGARVRWHPVHGPDIRKLRGRDPFAGEPLSGQYEWPYRRYDAECWADYYGVPFREPRDPHFDYRLLVKAATAAKRMGAVVPYSQALFRAVWVESVWPLDEDVCRQAAASVGLSSSEFGEVLLEPATDDELGSTAAEAHRRGAFGVPTLFVGDRMFWGNDRLVLVRHLLMTRTEESS
jgi:2-hydroxychromene-2-carboxylate isomerase